MIINICSTAALSSHQH